VGEFTKNLRGRTGMIGGKKIGYCVICGKHGKLSTDHVPPKGCITITDVELQTITAEYDEGLRQDRKLTVQGGIKFRTLCGECNNGRLGTRYDPHLKNFVDKIIGQLQWTATRIVHAPPIIHADINSHAVAKALIGHLLASHSFVETETRHEDIGASNSLRDYFLEKRASFPKEWQIFCWPYTSRRQIIIKHLGVMDTSMREQNEKSVYGHILKFMPLAFWFVYNKSPNFQIPGIDITPVVEWGSDNLETVALDLRKVPRIHFPENPTGNFVVLFNNEQTSVALPKKTKK
jgi:hypothetical protein